MMRPGAAKIRPRGLDAVRVTFVLLILTAAMAMLSRCTAWLDAYAARRLEAMRREQQRRESAELLASVEAFLAECRDK